MGDDGKSLPRTGTKVRSGNRRRYTRFHISKVRSLLELPSIDCNLRQLTSWPWSRPRKGRLRLSRAGFLRAGPSGCVKKILLSSFGVNRSALLVDNVRWANESGGADAVDKG